MADLTFEQAVSTIVGMKDEIVRALGETFVMVGLRPLQNPPKIP